MLHFLKPEDITSRYNFISGNILIAGAELPSLGGRKTKKPNHKSHLLILHKLPYKSSCLSPTPNDLNEQDSSFNGPAVDASDQTSRHLPFVPYKTNKKH